MDQILRKNIKDAVEANHEFWSISGSVIADITSRTGNIICASRRIIYIPLNYIDIDVVRHTQRS